jgi:hypothetical protein
MRLYSSTDNTVLASAMGLLAFYYTMMSMSSSSLTVSAFTTSPSWGGVMTTPSTRRVASSKLVVMNEQEDGKGSGFSLANLFGGGSGKEGAAAVGATTSALRGSSGKLEPHPSVRKHISPLNRLGPDPQVEPKSDPLPIHPDVRSGTLPNGLPYVILPNKSPPGRFEAHLQVFSGSGRYNFILLYPMLCIQDEVDDDDG